MGNVEIVTLRDRVVNGLTCGHRWELPGNLPVFAEVMVIYHYVERIRRTLVTPNFCTTYTIIIKYYPVEPVNIHIQ